MISECKKDLKKSVFGLVIGFSGISLFYLWKQGSIDFLNENFSFVFIAGLILIVWGMWLFAAYLRCVEELNKYN